MACPCIDVCRYDGATGWCFGCGMAKSEKKHWKKDKERRPIIRAALPAWLTMLGPAGHKTGEAARRKK